MANDLVPGDPAPDFSPIAVGAEYGEGTPVRLPDFRGRTVGLYFTRLNDLSHFEP
ncbi:MAG: hypothetical protein NTV93_17415 [Verrucomicrobia bacterium]|nr:hypothetical protein [Verrucomicrobiota bacterium]